MNQALPVSVAMHMKVLLPARVLLEMKVLRIVAEAPNGVFGILPRHADFVAALVPGVLSFTTEEGAEQLLGTDEGALVKRGADVLISVLNARRGADLASLRGEVEREYLALGEQERAARSALARLEAGVVRRFVELETDRR